MSERKFPIQKPHKLARDPSTVPESVYMAAYEVYAAVYGEQQALIDLKRGCRGGFGISELVVFLYARSFPRSEWRERVHEGHDTVDLG